jgi:SAM-dependent methyltransferase
VEPPKSRWLTSELAQTYLEGVRGAIPAAALQFEVILHVVGSWRPDARRILDLGCGDGALGRMLLERLPAVHIVFADFSEPMLDAARAKVSGEPRATVVKADYSSPAWLDAVKGFVPFDVVVSGFSIHHQPHEGQRRIYSEIHGALKPGGIFLNLEHVAAATPAVEALYNEFFVDHLFDYHRRKNPGADRALIARAYYDRTDKVENILAPVDEQCRWLRDIGFADVDCFFRLFELAIFGGVKRLP